MALIRNTTRPEMEHGVMITGQCNNHKSLNDVTIKITGQIATRPGQEHAGNVWSRLLLWCRPVKQDNNTARGGAHGQCLVEITVLRREADRKHNPARSGAGGYSLVELLSLKETRVLNTSVDLSLIHI